MAKKGWKDKNWSCLTTFKSFVVSELKEKVISFNGYELETDKAVYMLYDGRLVIKEK